MFVICSAFVINSITKASAPCHVVKVKPVARGLALLLLQLREKVEASENSSHLHIMFGTETLWLSGGGICFCSICFSCREGARCFPAFLCSSG